MESCRLVRFVIAVLILFLFLRGIPGTASLSGKEELTWVSSCENGGRPRKLGQNCRARMLSVDNTVIWFQSLRVKQSLSPPAPRRARTRNYIRNLSPPPPKPQNMNHNPMPTTPPSTVPPPPSRR